MNLYGLKSCDTCRKALAALRAAGREVTFVDVRAEGVPEAVLLRARNTFGATLLNTRSTTWRGLSDAERSRDALALLADHPTLMKRPLIDADGGLHLGWSKETQGALGL
ncbi:MAG: ArsC/Spx/MgsR family protein [Pseudomonadota bacterium]